MKSETAKTETPVLTREEIEETVRNTNPTLKMSLNQFRTWIINSIPEAEIQTTDYGTLKIKPGASGLELEEIRNRILRVPELFVRPICLGSFEVSILPEKTGGHGTGWCNKCKSYCWGDCQSA